MKLKIKSESDKIKSQYIIFNILQILATLACIATFVFFIIMGVRLLVNSLYVAAASQDVYIEAPEKMIGRQVTFLDRYVTRYNIGNGRYAAGDYDSAVNNYEKALSEGILGGRKCKTCVNLALSRTKTIDFETIYSEFGKFKKGQDIDREALINQIKDAIGVLEDAGEDLTANGCTGEEPDMSIPEEDRETARLLKEDIDKEIEELKKMLAELMQGGEGGDSQGEESPDGGSGSGKKASQNGSGGTTSREDKIKGELEKQQREAMEEQSEAEEDYEWYKEQNGQNEGGPDGDNQDENSQGGKDKQNGGFGKDQQGGGGGQGNGDDESEPDEDKIKPW